MINTLLFIMANIKVLCNSMFKVHSVKEVKLKSFLIQ